MSQDLKQMKKLGLALAVAAVTGSVTTAVWAADNTVGTGRGVALGTGSRASVNTEDSIAIGECFGY